MIPAAFDYHSPQSLDEALSLLKQHGGDAKILAGGQSLIPAMRFRLAVPAILIDINRLNDLRYVEERGDHLAIGEVGRARRGQAPSLGSIRSRPRICWNWAT